MPVEYRTAPTSPGNRHYESEIAFPRPDTVAELRFGFDDGARILRERIYDFQIVEKLSCLEVLAQKIAAARGLRGRNNQ